MRIKIMSPFEPTLKYLGEKIYCIQCNKKIHFWSTRIEFYDDEFIKEMNHINTKVYSYHPMCFIERMVINIRKEKKENEN